MPTIQTTFQNLQVLEEARNAARLNLKSRYQDVIQPFVAIIRTVMKANNENHFEAVKRIQDHSDLMKEDDKKIIFAAALMEIVDAENLSDFTAKK